MKSECLTKSSQSFITSFLPASFILCSHPTNYHNFSLTLTTDMFCNSLWQLTCSVTQKCCLYYSPFYIKLFSSYIYTMPISPIRAWHSPLLVSYRKHLTQTYKHLQEDRNPNLPFLPGLQGYKPLQYLFTGRWAGILAFKKTNPFCLHKAWDLNLRHLSCKPSMLTAIPQVHYIPSKYLSS